MTSLLLTPEVVRWLNQPDPTTLSWVVLLSVAQWCLLTSTTHYSWSLLWTAVCLGAPLCSALYQCSVELAQNLCFGQPEKDRVLAIVANWVTGVPYAEWLRASHTAHLSFHNSPATATTRDPEVPGDWELQHVHGTAAKALYLLLHPWFLIGRWWRMRRTLAPSVRSMLWVNGLSQTVFNLWVWYGWGTPALMYMWTSTYLAATPWHPVAYYFLTQHHVCTADMSRNVPARTYSYYGVLNGLTLNAGYHRERHLCPRVPWSRLPLVRQLYRLRTHSSAVYRSWWQVIHEFVTEPVVTLHS